MRLARNVRVAHVALDANKCTGTESVHLACHSTLQWPLKKINVRSLIERLFRPTYLTCFSAIAMLPKHSTAFDMSLPRSIFCDLRNCLTELMVWRKALVCLSLRNKIHWVQREDPPVKACCTSPAAHPKHSASDPRPVPESLPKRTTDQPWAIWEDHLLSFTTSWFTAIQS